MLSRPAAPPAAAGERSWVVLEAGLKASDYATRLFAAEALGCVHDERAVAHLAHLLGDPEEDVRIAAVSALQKQPGAASRRHLETVRDDEEEELLVRVLATAALLSPQSTCTERN